MGLWKKEKRTWDDIVQILTDEFSVAESDEEGISVDLIVDDNERAQRVIIAKLEQDDGSLWLAMMSAVGLIQPEHLDEALELLDKQAFGGLTKAGDLHWVRAMLPADGLSNDDISTWIYGIAVAADTLEEKFIGKDEF